MADKEEQRQDISRKYKQLRKLILRDHPDKAKDVDNVENGDDEPASDDDAGSEDFDDHVSWKKRCMAAETNANADRDQLTRANAVIKTLQDDNAKLTTDNQNLKDAQKKLDAVTKTLLVDNNITKASLKECQDSLQNPASRGQTTRDGEETISEATFTPELKKLNQRDGQQPISIGGMTSRILVPQDGETDHGLPDALNKSKGTAMARVVRTQAGGILVRFEGEFVPEAQQQSDQEPVTQSEEETGDESDTRSKKSSKKSSDQRFNSDDDSSYDEDSGGKKNKKKKKQKGGKGHQGKQVPKPASAQTNNRNLRKRKGRDDDDDEYGKPSPKRTRTGKAQIKKISHDD